MNSKLTGEVVYHEVGVGTWALVTANQQTYELRDPPAALRQSGLKVEIEGVIREDIMTIAMIGPVLEIKSFRLLT